MIVRMIPRYTAKLLLLSILIAVPTYNILLLHTFIQTGRTKMPSNDDPKVQITDSTDLARKQSFGFFTDITESSWERLRDLASSREDHLFKNKHASFGIGDKEQHHPDGSKQVVYQWFQSHYEPNFSCQFKKRVGRNGLGDGPKWICDPHRLLDISKARKRSHPDRPGCVIYSVGSNGDFSFELALQKMLGKDTCEIHIFDMDDFEAKMPKGMNMYFHHWGLDHKYRVDHTKGHVYKTFNQTMKTLGHLNLPAIDIFKIDCEGCEFSTFSDWLDESTPMFQQILVEIHARTADQMKSLFDGFKEAGYVRFSKEHNTQYPNLVCYEYSFLKLSKDFWKPNAVDPGMIIEE